MTHRTSIYYCDKCKKLGHGEKAGWMESTENNGDVNVVISGPLKFVGDAEERDAMEVFDDEVLAAGHTYYVIKGGDTE